MKNNKINHYPRLHNDDAIRALSPFEEAFPGTFPFVSFTRVHKTGHITAASTNSPFIQSFFGHSAATLQKSRAAFLNKVAQDCLSKQSRAHSYLFQAYPEIREIEQYLSQQLKLQHCSGYFHITDEYYDSFILSTHPENLSALNIYVNESEKIKKLCHLFAERSTDFLKQFEPKNILIPQSQHYTNATQQFFSAISQIKIAQLPHTKLTTRQMDCLALLLKGFTAKMIAHKLHLSHRTVETHLEHIKNNLGCLRKSELIEYGLTHLKHLII